MSTSRMYGFHQSVAAGCVPGVLRRIKCCGWTRWVWVYTNIDFIQDKRQQRLQTVQKGQPVNGARNLGLSTTFPTTAWAYAKVPIHHSALPPVLGVSNCDPALKTKHCTWFIKYVQKSCPWLRYLDQAQPPSAALNSVPHSHSQEWPVF